MQNLSLLVHPPGEGLVQSFRRLFAPPKNQLWRASCFFRQVARPTGSFRDRQTIWTFSSTVQRFFFPFSGREGFSMRTFLSRQG